METVPNESDRDMFVELVLLLSGAVGDTTNVVSSPFSMAFFNFFIEGVLKIISLTLSGCIALQSAQ